MVKESTERCRDCDGTEFMGGGLFSDIGNGRCSHCHGSGRLPSFISGLAAPFVDCEPDMPCDVCSETGQCQTCGGNGYVFINESNSNDKKEEHSNHNGSSDSSLSNYPSGGYGGGSYGGSSSENPALGCVGALALIAIVSMIIGALKNTPVTYTNTLPNNSSSQLIDTVRKYSPDQIKNTYDTLAYPDSDKVKSDLIGKTMPHWHFEDLSEIREFEIINEHTMRDTLFVIIDLKLNDVSTNKIKFLGDFGFIFERQQ